MRHIHGWLLQSVINAAINSGIIFVDMRILPLFHDRRTHAAPAARAAWCPCFAVQIIHMIRVWVNKIINIVKIHACF
jgi:hypothetical protein